MNQFRIYTLMLSFVLAFVIGFGQGDAKANKIIKDSHAKFESLKDISADFVYTITNPSLDKPIVKSGSLNMKGNKYMIKFSEEQFYCDGKTIWVYLVDEEEVTITDYSEEESMSVERIYKTYEDNTKSKYDKEDGNAHKVSLFMQDDDSDVWKVEMWINKSTKLIDKAVMHGRNGSIYKYQLNKIKTNAGLSDSKFTFDPNAHDGIYTNDLRENP